MDVDDPVAVFLAEPSGEDLHVAAEDGEFPGDVADGVTHLAESRMLSLLVGWNRDVEEGNALFLNGGAECLVIGDYERDLDVHLLGAPAPKHIGKAMILLADKKDGFERAPLVADRPTGIDTDGHRGECRAHHLKRRPLRNLEGKPGEKPPVDLIRVLVDLDEIPMMPRDETRHRSQQPDPVGAVDRHQERGGRHGEKAKGSASKAEVQKGEQPSLEGVGEFLSPPLASALRLRF